jgi:hypothetical protein
MSNARSRYAAATLLAAAAIALPSAAQVEPPQRSLAYISEPGDPVGQERSGTAVARFQYARPEAISIAAYDGTVSYDLWLAPPAGQRLQPGVYEDARGGAEDAPGRPQLAFSSDRACEGSRGRFEISDIAYDDAGKVVRLRANFEQRCTGATGSLWGDVALDAGLVAYTASLERIGTYAPEHAVAYMVVQCIGTPTWGELQVRALQRARDGSTVTGYSEKTFGCGPEPRRVSLDLLSDTGSAWRPGPVQVEVRSFVQDPHYDEAGRVLRETLQGTVSLAHSRRLSRPERPSVAAGR